QIRSLALWPEEDPVYIGFCGLFDIVDRMNHEDGLNMPRKFICFHSNPQPTEVGIVATRLTHFDGSSADDLTAGEVEARRQAMHLAELMAKRVPGFANAYLSAAAHQVGIRE